VESIEGVERESIETTWGGVVSALRERPEASKSESTSLPGNARVFHDILEILTRPTFGRGKRCKRLDDIDDLQSLIATSSGYTK